MFAPHCELFHFFQITLFFQRHLFFDLTIQCGFFNNYQSLSISSVPASVQAKSFTNIEDSDLRESTHITDREKLHIHSTKKENVNI